LLLAALHSVASPGASPSIIDVIRSRFRDAC
jgi:hypothetical protein